MFDVDVVLHSRLWNAGNNVVCENADANPERRVTIEVGLAEPFLKAEGLPCSLVVLEPQISSLFDSFERLQQ